MAKSPSDPTRLTWLALGKCKCIKEPKGTHGLDGYIKGQRYRCERRFGQGRYYFRIWPDDDDHTYFHVCAERTFKRFFE